PEAVDPSSDRIPLPLDHEADLANWVGFRAKLGRRELNGEGGCNHSARFRHERCDRRLKHVVAIVDERKRETEHLSVNKVAWMESANRELAVVAAGGRVGWRVRVSVGRG